MKLTIDLGGTNIRIAQVENGACLNTKSIPCLSNESASTVINQLTSLISSMMNEKVEIIGIGVPSILDPEKGIVYNVANIPSWEIIPLKEIIEEKFGIPTTINNDSNCFALGEKHFGEGKAFHNMVGVTIGTGIGAGVIINNELYSGQYAGAGEVGSLPYLDADFEHYCSSQFFKLYHNTTGEILAEKAALKDEYALTLWKEFGEHLGNFIKAILYTYSPQAIILGGGIVPAYPYFKEAMEETIKSFPYKEITKELKIIPSTLKNASLLGASMLTPTK